MERPTPSEKDLEAHVQSLRKDARDEFRAKQARVLAVSHRLKTGAIDLCGEEVGPQLGATIARRLDLVGGTGKIEEMEDALGVEDKVKFLVVLDGSPADRAGLRSGDLILGVNGSATKKATDVFGELRSSTEGSIRLDLRREGSRMVATLPTVEGCNHGIFVRVDSDAITRPHDNRHDVVVSTGLVRYVRDDDELAIAIAHQIAHQLLGTPRPGRGSEEPPADRLGLFLAARAGFDVSKGPAFWDRLAADEPWRVHSDVSWGPGGRYRLWHTGMALRGPVIRETTGRIRALIEAGAPLEP